MADAGGGEDAIEDMDGVMAEGMETTEEEDKMAEVLAAAEQGDLERLRALCAENPARATAAGEDGDTALHMGALYGKQGQYHGYQCAAGACDRDLCQEQIGTLVLNRMSLAIVEECLRLGADVNARDEDDSTALHDACAGGFTSIAQILIKAGADVAAVDSDGETPLHTASNGGHAATVAALLEAAGADRGKLLEMRNAADARAVDLAETEELKGLLQ